MLEGQAQDLMRVCVLVIKSSIVLCEAQVRTTPPMVCKLSQYGQAMSRIHTAYLAKISTWLSAASILNILPDPCAGCSAFIIQQQTPITEQACLLCTGLQQCMLHASFAS